MRTRITTVAVAAVVGVAGLTGAAVLAPTLATAADTATSVAEEAGSRLDRIKEALGGLVGDGTITQEQADRVAETLDEALPHRGHGHGPGKHLLREGLGTAAEALGLEPDELRERLRDGSTLADVAETEGVAVEDLVDALVTAAEERLAEAVEDGRVTQERADEIAATLEERLTERIDDPLPRRGDGRGRHGGHGGPGFFGGDDAPEEAPEDAPAEAPEATPTA